jgi:hypothetical protein
VKFTFQVEPNLVGVAASLATDFIGTYLPQGDRPTASKSVIMRTGAGYFAVWGTSAHVRVYQENPHE